MNENLPLKQLHGLPQTPNVRPTPIVIRLVAQHQVPGDVATVVVHFNAAVGGGDVGGVLQEVGLFPGSRAESGGGAAVVGRDDGADAAHETLHGGRGG